MSDTSSSGEATKPPQHDGGYAAIPNWLVRDPEFTYQDKLVYMVLSSHTTRDDSWFMSHAQIADEAGISVSSVQRALKRLDGAFLISWVGRINEKTGARLGNAYRVHPSPTVSHPDVPPRSHVPTPSVPLTEQKKNPEEEPRRTNTLAPQAARNIKGSRLPEGWMPSPGVAGKMRAECPELDLTREHRQFSDHWAASALRSAVKKDWDAAWRFWMRNACQRLNERRQVGQPTTKAVLDAQWAAFLNERPAASVAAFCPSHDGYPLPCEKCRRES